MNNSKIKNNEVIYNLNCFPNAHVILFWFQVQTFLYFFSPILGWVIKYLFKKEKEKEKAEAEDKPFPTTKHGPTSDIMSLKIKIPINQNKIKKILAEIRLDLGENLFRV